MPEKVRALGNNEDAQRNLQAPWLIRVAGELHHTTMCDGAKHPNVGLFWKDYGNHFEQGDLKISTDILVVKDTDDPNVVAIFDVIVSANGPDSRPGWPGGELLTGSDAERFRVPPVPVVEHTDPPVVNPPDTPTPVPVPVIDEETKALLRGIYKNTSDSLLLQDRAVSTLEGLRRDVLNGGKVLAALVAGGGLGGGGSLIDIIGGLIPKKTAAHGMGVDRDPRTMKRRPEGFDRHEQAIDGSKKRS
jgi:hypothetical protein